MQTHGGGPAGVAIEASERRLFMEIKVDWNRDGLFTHYLSDLSNYADNVTVDRSLAGSAPQEIMLIEGAAAAELSFDVTGRDPNNNLSFVGVFSPYNGLSPFYNLDPIGCEVTYRIGVDTSIGIIWYPQFVGNIRTITPNRATGVVTITALDRVEKLRNPVQFPQWGMSEYMSLRGYNKAQTMDSQWVIDHCARFGDTSTTPYRPLYPEEFTKTDAERDDGIRFWLTGTGSHVPSVGFMTGDTSQGFPFSESVGGPMYYANGLKHPNGDSGYSPMSLSSLGPDNTGITSSGLNSSAYNTYWALDRNTDNILGSHYIGFTMNNTQFNGKWWRTSGNLTTVIQCHAGYHMKFMVTVYQGNIRGEIRNYNTGSGIVSDWFVLPDLDHITVDVVFACGAGASNTFIGFLINGTTQYINNPVADWSSYMNSNFDPYTGYVTVEHKIGLTDVYWSSRWEGTGGVYDDNQFTVKARRKAKYAAVLDQGLNKLTHLPVTNSDDAWNIITSVAAAELGSVFWDENGIFRFWNRNTIVGKQSTTWRVFSLDHVQGLQITNSFDSIRNIVTSESTRGFARTQVAYDSSSIEEFYVPGNTRVKFIRFIDNMQSFGLNKVVRYRSSYAAGSYPLWANDGDYEGYVVQWLVSGSWSEDNGRTSGVDVWPYGNEDGSVTIEIFNGYSEPARLATGGPSDSASAALRVLGSLVMTDETAVLTKSDVTSIAKYGKRNLSLNGDWVQWQPDVVTSLLNYVLPRTLNAIPTTDAITVVGDPRLQLGDRVDVVDSKGMGEQIGLQIYGITRSFSRDNGLTDTLTVEMLAPARIGYWDSAQYGRWDETFIWQ